MKIIDCFIFYNELAILQYRIKTLFPLVDYFVLVESTKTFNGNEKPLYYQENKYLFTEAQQAKIIHLICNDLCKPDYILVNAWINEHKQRNFIQKAFTEGKCGLMENEDVVLVCDLDEIPNPTLLQNLRNQKIVLDSQTLYAMQMDMYYYNLLHRQNTETWQKAKLLTFQHFLILQDNINDKIRMASQYNVFLKGGWHLSYFGDAHFISDKIQQFSHQEFNHARFTDKEKIIEKMKQGVDLFNRPGGITRIELHENTFLPPLEGLENFQCDF